MLQLLGENVRNFQCYFQTYQNIHIFARISYRTYNSYVHLQSFAHSSPCCYKLYLQLLVNLLVELFTCTHCTIAFWVFEHLILTKFKWNIIKMSKFNGIQEFSLRNLLAVKTKKIHILKKRHLFFKSWHSIYPFNLVSLVYYIYC